MQTPAEKLAELLTKYEVRVVFAESCTAGLVAATVARVPGISHALCGSVVTYRESMKTTWLNVDPRTLEEKTAVSAEVTEQMVSSVMERTEEASFGAAITGHLGPNAPEGLDGVIFVSLARRNHGSPLQVQTLRHQLRRTGREARQCEAVEYVLEDLSAWIPLA
ncbi:MAG: nicotinamide-nucleotide amidohydrolase family protein [Pirellulaceae bacterium]